MQERVNFMSYNLNIKRVFKVIGIQVLFIILLILVILMFLNSTGTEKIESIAQLLLLNIPLFVIFSGGFGVLLIIYLNMRILFYKQKDLLIITNEEIIYDNYINGKIIIKKEDILKIYPTFHSDDLLIRNKYLGIITNKEIKQRNRKLLKIFRINNNKKLIYINLSELNADPEKIASDIENTLNIPINKKGKNSYFGKNIFPIDKL